ncbi:serine hydrolase [Chitinophaga sp. SYP-B3965]|uniref:serine hydrolase domain-containing protein n=1 Tax=Chitinophaga sp. SYP-B3965 TaxID=2663120 RepID=UPI00129988AC|nr:serine hydrolase domain-containing protein [Chitinophaga sp. SYP-B3965]MRG47445.1 serine hydrolase [Chitinophaga sp. SYP-B3965]
MKKLTLALLLTGAMSSFGQSKNIASIDSLLTDMTRRDLFSGAVLIADSSGVLLSKGYGYSDRENKIKNTPATRFSLSSASKVFTGTAITYLAQQGKLKFTDTLGQYLKGFPSGDVITIHQMLTHSAGLDDFFKAQNFSYENVKNCTDMLPFMRSLPLVYPPGDSCLYSTGDCIVLGAIIEKITGMDFQDYIKAVFIDPLGLSNTSFTPYWTLDDSQRKYAIGYRKGYQRIPFNYDNGSIPLSAGGAWSSVEDIYKFDKAVFSGKVVQEEFLSQMTGRYTSSWENSHFGYIWITTDKKNGDSIGHSGDSSGWHAMNEYYPKQGYTVIILTSFGAVDLYELSGKVEEMLFAK